MSTFNPASNCVRIEGYAGDPELEVRVNNCKERGYEEVTRHQFTKVDKYFTKRGLYQTTRERHKVLVILKRTEETK